MSELKGKTAKELLKLLGEKKKSLHAFKLGNAGSKTKNVKEGRTIRKDIARIMTELNVLAAASKKEAAKTA